MDEALQKTDAVTTNTYLAVVSMIDNIQSRLKWSELFYVFLNLALFFPTIYFFMGSHLTRAVRHEFYTYILFIFFCHVIGLFINTYWAAASARLHLTLKLRYFQARFLERKLNQAGGFIFSDEEPFFDPENGKLKSPDGKETLSYPKRGFFRMDGFMGSARPRVLSLLIPSLFFILYLVSLISFIFYLF